MFYEMERMKDESVVPCGTKWNHQNQRHNSERKQAPKPCMQHTPVMLVMRKQMVTCYFWKSGY